MDIKKIAEGLHPLERAVLPHLRDKAKLDELVLKTRLKEVEVMRALQWLENKKILKIKQDVVERIVLDKNGRKYLKEGLPERRFLEQIKDETDIKDVKLEKDEINICLGIMKKKAAIEIMQGMKIRLTKNGKDIMGKEMLEEKFLKRLPLEVKELSDEDRYAYNELRKRKQIVRGEIIKIKTVELKETGERLIKIKVSDSMIDSLKSELIRNGRWKNKKFRRYDVRINVPKIYPGKRHFVNQVAEYVRRVWLDLGFKEMQGPMLQTSFWNFDALFTAQDHPVREMQDTFFIKEPKYGKLPDKRLVEKIRKVHENGWTTGSKGWGGKWSEDEAKRNCLRTHTTVLSARTIARLRKEEWPAKFFAVGKNFRNETLDWSHLFEFNQFEGIVVDPDANFRHLLGYLKEFFRKMGFERARFRPAYFAYTCFSTEIEVFHPLRKEWIELGGAGIFRPEVVKPLLGEDIPVLAWGPGMDRQLMDYYKITDIRDLYRNDLRKLEEMKIWLR